MSEFKWYDKRSYGDNWKELSAACKERDNYTCRKCKRYFPPGTRKNIHADHIVPISGGGKNKLTNLQTLCIWCHEKKTNANRKLGHEVNWTKKAGKKPARIFYAKTNQKFRSRR